MVLIFVIKSIDTAALRDRPFIGLLCLRYKLFVALRGSVVCGILSKLDMFRFSNGKTNLDDYDANKKLYPLYRIAYVFALYPLIEIHNKNPGVSVWYRYFAGVYSLYGRAFEIYPFLPATIVIIDVLNGIVICLTNAVSIVWVSVIGGRDICRLVGHFARIDEIVGNNRSFSYTDRNRLIRFYVEFIFGQIFVVCYYIYDGVLWTDALGVRIYENYLLRSVQSYSNFITTLLIRYIILFVEGRFRDLNELLAILDRRCLYRNGNGGRHRPSKDSKDIIRVYNTLLEQIHIVNRVFGMSMLFLSFCFITGLLNMLIMGITYYVQNQNEMKGVVFGPDMLILCGFGVLKDLVSYLLLVSSCDRTVREAGRISFMCYKLLYESSPFDRKTFSRYDITLLAMQSSATAVCFSAAGFFSMDYTTLFTLIGFVTSYLVVLIQFNHN